MLPYSEAGAGPTVVLVHAGICDRTMWDDHLEPLAAAGYHALAFDLPGFGEAPPEPGVQRPWIDLLLALDELDILSAALVGNSYGGGVALRTAITIPPRFWALGLISAPGPGLEPSPGLLDAWDAEEQALARGDVDGAVDGVLDAWVLPSAPAGVRERVAAMQRRAFAIQGGIPPAAEPVDPAEQPGALASLRRPALVACGAHEFPDFAVSADRLATALPAAERHTFDHAGHLAPLETPGAFRERLIAFLDAARP